MKLKRRRGKFSGSPCLDGQHQCNQQACDNGNHYRAHYPKRCADRQQKLFLKIQDTTCTGQQASLVSRAIFPTSQTTMSHRYSSQNL